MDIFDDWIRDDLGEPGSEICFQLAKNVMENGSDLANLFYIYNGGCLKMLKDTPQSMIHFFHYILPIHIYCD